MERTQVTSSNIRSIGWEGIETDDVLLDSELPGVLEVEFNNGAIWQYRIVPRGVFEQVLGGAVDQRISENLGTVIDAAAVGSSGLVSVGRQFHRLVKGNKAYTATKVKDADERPTTRGELDGPVQA